MSRIVFSDSESDGKDPYYHSLNALEAVYVHDSQIVKVKEEDALVFRLPLGRCVCQRKSATYTALSQLA